MKNEAGFVHTTVQRVLSQGMSATGVLALFPFWPANKPAVQLRWSSGDEKDIQKVMMYSENLVIFTSMFTVLCEKLWVGFNDASLFPIKD